MWRRSIILFLIVFPCLVTAYTSPGQPTGLVNDFAGVLTATERQSLEQKLSDFEKQTSSEIAVVTIKSLGGDTIENYAVKLFEEWGIGKKGKDNGILLLVSKNDRQMRIEVGYGLEGALPDSVAVSIISNILRPAFRQNDYAGGLSRGVDAIIQATKGEYTAPPAPKNSALPWQIDPMFIIFAVVAAIQWFIAIMARSKSWWLGGVFGFLAGLILTWFFGFFFVGLLGMVLLAPLGLWLDYTVSRRYEAAEALGGHIPWYLGGPRGGSGSFGGDFGGFGGGRSGGGGGSGSW